MAANLELQQPTNYLKRKHIINGCGAGFSKCVIVQYTQS